MKIDRLWNNYKFRVCEECEKDCGKYEYDNLCSNLNYLKSYGEGYYAKMKESFQELSSAGIKRPIFFSFGCGCCLDYVAAKEVFENAFSYINVDECEWAIKNTAAYRKLAVNMPQRNFKFVEGMSLLKVSPERIVVCFFNSLNDILGNQIDFESKLIATLKYKGNFAIVCNYTRGGNHTLAWDEECFLNNCCKELKKQVSIKRVDILSGEGIIILGERK